MFVLATIIAYTHKFVLENKNKEKVKSAMGKYISQDIMKKVTKMIFGILSAPSVACNLLLSYFLYENGGENSIHPKENIKRMSKKTAQEWLENN